jgi:exodeoxyribonuclease VII small subunit
MTKASSDKPDFSTKLQELEAITTWFESEEVDLNAALAKFERGMQLADELRRELSQVENRVEKIKAKFDAPAAEADAPEAGDGGDGDPDRPQPQPTTSGVATPAGPADTDSTPDTDDEPTLF